MGEAISAREGYSEALEIQSHGASIRRNQGSSGAISEHRHLSFVRAAETASETCAAAEAAVLAAGEGRK